MSYIDLSLLCMSAGGYEETYLDTADCYRKLQAPVAVLYTYFTLHAGRSTHSSPTFVGTL